jgi:hypothetical protein
MNYPDRSWTVLGIVTAVVSVGVLGALTGCGSSGSGALAPGLRSPGVIKGVAMSRATATTPAVPLANAKVTAVNPSTGAVVAGPVTSDAQGNFELDNVPAGPETVVVEGADTGGLPETGSASVDVQSGQTGQVEVDTQQTGANKAAATAGKASVPTAASPVSQDPQTGPDQNVQSGSQTQIQDSAPDTSTAKELQGKG